MKGKEQDDLRRYGRQIRFEPIDLEGQRKLLNARVVIVGCGALGAVIADQLVRAGVGTTVLVDRDVIELHNLQRQHLFTEADVTEGLPKAVAAQRHLQEANSKVKIEAVVADLNHRNAPALCDKADIIVDGTDNFETRFLLNDISLELAIPWIFGGAVGGEGQVKAIVPGETSCLRCLIDDIPDPGQTPTCETAGIIAAAPGVVASLQVAMALRILTGAGISGDLIVIDVWNGRFRRAAVPKLTDCPACAMGRRDFLEGKAVGTTTVLCGRDTVQVIPAVERSLDLANIAESLRDLGSLKDRMFYLEFDDGSFTLSIFPDGRCLIKGTGDSAVARSVVAKYLGG